jgi:hypothetical protein
MTRFGALRFLFCAALMTPQLAFAQRAADDVAAQVRAQGHPCEPPVTARRNMRRSRPDSAVWILRCQNAKYGVRLDPDMAAHIVRYR